MVADTAVLGWYSEAKSSVDPEYENTYPRAEHSLETGHGGSPVTHASAVKESVSVNSESMHWLCRYVAMVCDDLSHCSLQSQANGLFDMSNISIRS